MKTITVRELLKQITENQIEMDAGVYIAKGESEGDYEMVGIKSLGFDEDGEVYLILETEEGEEA